MNVLVKTIKGEAPLQGMKPDFAASYYAISTAKLSRKSADVFCLRNGTLTVDFSVKHCYRFSVHSSDGAWLSKPAQAYELKPIYERVIIDQNVAFLEDRFTVFNICHFLFDKLGRTTEFNDIQVDSFLLFQSNDYIRNVLEILNIFQTDLGETKNGVVTYQFDNLYVSSSTFSFNHPGFNFRPEVIRLLSQLRTKCVESSTAISAGTRLFIDRKKVGRRDIVNRESLDALLKQYGFDSIFFEDHSFDEQVAIVRGADVLMGVHGAGLSNGLFFNDVNFKLLEIFPPLCATAVYWKLASAFGFNYDGFIADDLEFPTPDYETWKHNSALSIRNISIDYERFDQFLNHHLN